MAATVLTTGCAGDDVHTEKGEPVSVELAYAFSSSATTKTTRQAAEVVTTPETYPRRPHDMRIIPMVNRAPRMGEFSWNEPVSKDNPSSLFYRTRHCHLGVGVNGFLVYGTVQNLTPTTPVHTKMFNGSLVEHFPSSITTVDDVEEGISFNLESICPDADVAPEGAQALADCMNTIAAAGNWNTSADPELKTLFDKFTNNGNPLPGSAASLGKWVEQLRTSISGQLDDQNPSVLDAVDAAAAAQLTAIAASDYPRNLQLPDGAAVLRWADVREGNETVKRFVPQVRATTLDNINSLARFAYPAPLYYFIASEIKTSEEYVNLSTLYNSAESNAIATAWEQVLANERFNRISVSANTRSVVMTHPVQHAVGQLKVNIRALSTTLKDADGVDVTVGSSTFPLTGIIICDQRPVDYKFEPREVQQGTVSNADVLFIYDSQVETDCRLTAQSEWKPACNTLVLQSYQNEDVHVILELQNNGADFKGIDGIVYSGTRFYLIGKVEAPLYITPDPNVNSENRDQVFTKDYITTVNMTVSSLARAYNVPPNLLSNNLEIGVETTPQWEGATPSVIRLE